MVALAETAATVLRAEAEEGQQQEGQTRETMTDSVRVSKTGPKPSPDSEARVAERLGLPRMTLNDAKHQVETAEAYPFMQNPDWKQSHVLAARQSLHQIAEPDRAEGRRGSVGAPLSPAGATAPRGTR